MNFYFSHPFYIQLTTEQCRVRGAGLHSQKYAFNFWLPTLPQYLQATGSRITCQYPQVLKTLIKWCTQLALLSTVSQQWLCSLWAVDWIHGCRTMEIWRDDSVVVGSIIIVSFLPIITEACIHFWEILSPLVLKTPYIVSLFIPSFLYIWLSLALSFQSTNIKNAAIPSLMQNKNKNEINTNEETT